MMHFQREKLYETWQGPRPQAIDGINRFVFGIYEPDSEQVIQQHASVALMSRDITVRSVPHCQETPQDVSSLIANLDSLPFCGSFRGISQSLPIFQPSPNARTRSSADTSRPTAHHGLAALLLQKSSPTSMITPLLGGELFLYEQGHTIAILDSADSPSPAQAPPCALNIAPLVMFHPNPASTAVPRTWAAALSPAFARAAPTATAETRAGAAVAGTPGGAAAAAGYPIASLTAAVCHECGPRRRRRGGRRGRRQGLVSAPQWYPPAHCGHIRAGPEPAAVRW
jgi:hypothetical protein